MYSESEARANMLSLRLADGKTAEAAAAVACKCVTIRNMVTNCSETAGGGPPCVPLPIDVEEMGTVIRFYEQSEGTSTSIIEGLSDAGLCRVASAANYLEATELLEVATHALAGRIERLTTVAKIRARLGITSDMEPAEVARALREPRFTADWTDAAPCCPVVDLLGGMDVFDLCLLQMRPSTLYRLKGVSTTWRSAARRVLCAPEWQARQLSLRDLICGGPLLKNALQRRLKTSPEEAARPNRLGQLPLHLAVQSRSAASSVQALIAAYPAAVYHYDHCDMLPLELAIESGFAQAVKAIVTAAPAAASELDFQGFLPLHLALQYSAPHAVLKALLEAFPEAAGVRDGDGMLPLHIALAEHLPERTIKLLVTAHPSSVEQRDGEGSPSLHLAVRFGSSPAVLRTLILACPAAATVADFDGCNALHFALEAFSSDAVFTLLAYGPAAAAELNNEGCLPLHTALQNLAPTAVIKAIVSAFPSAVSRTDGNCAAPLHLALRNMASIETVKFLLQQHRESVYIRDITGALPLHIAAGYGAPLTILKALLRQFPAAAETSDDANMLPLHHAVLGITSKECMAILLQAFREGAKSRDNAHRLPFDLALEHAGCDKVLALLIDADMPISQDDGLPVGRHCYSWVRAVADRRCTAAVQVLLSPRSDGGFGYGRYARALATTKSKRGRAAIEVAQPVIEAELRRYMGSLDAKGTACGKRDSKKIGKQVAGRQTPAFSKMWKVGQQADAGDMIRVAEKDDQGCGLMRASGMPPVTIDESNFSPSPKAESHLSASNETEQEISGVMEGSIKWYSRRQGFGFIAWPAGNCDLRVRKSDIHMDHASKRLKKGDSVFFTLLKTHNGRRRAAQVRVRE